ncbi:MAG: glycerate dehydrogenase [Planctomycetota bacterium]|nr:MAG: glycerate dehydrogenase [Planctomycetota bacterium]
MENICVLDGYTLNPGDLSWSEIECFGDLTVYDRTSAEEVFAAAQDATIILTNKAIVNSSTIKKLPNLKLISVLATGYNIVDIQAAKENNISVCNVPGYSSMSVAQQVISMILDHTNNISSYSNSVKNDKWVDSKDFTFIQEPLIELADLTLGVIGYGDIAKKVITIAISFGLKVIVHTRTVPTEKLEQISFVGKDQLFHESDFISLNCPWNDQTNEIINKNSISQMKDNCFIVNTGRGQLINEDDLANALNNNAIAGASLDVLSQEPPKRDNPLLKAKNITITPHIAWSTIAARKRLMTQTGKNIKAFIEGNPINVVNS